LTNVIACVRHVLTQRPHPKQRPWLTERWPSAISLAPSWHLSTHAPQLVQEEASVTEVAGDVSRWGARPNLSIPESTPQQHEQQLHTLLTTSGS